MKVFLDIDGVMVHANPHRTVELEKDGFYKFTPKAIIAINSIKNAEIILSTSHRHRYEIEIWEKMFIERGVHFNSISMIETARAYGVSRREEIEEWVKIKKYPASEIIIIDDDSSLNALPKYLKDRLVLTSPYRGLYDRVEIKRILEESGA